LSSGNNQKIDKILRDLVRGNSTGLSAVISKTAEPFCLNHGKTTIYSYHIALDAHGRPVYKNLAKLIAKRVIDFAIPRSKVLQAQKEDYENGRTEAVEALSQEAHALFSRQPTSGEGGELFLSTLAEYLLGYPQLMTKMNLKTNAQVHAHGSDAIHGTVGTNGALALCWGESKLYKDSNSAVDECISSLAPFLLDEGGSEDRKSRDMILLRDGLSLTNSTLVEALKRYLDPEDPAHLQLEHRGICLIGYDVGCYNSDVPLSPEQLVRLLQPITDKVAERVNLKVSKEKVHHFQIDVFQVPFPDVQAFRDAFRLELRV
jgi:hypothetical protein